jgi:multidrug efflux system membrane fusion protein
LNEQAPLPPDASDTGRRKVIRLVKWVVAALVCVLVVVLLERHFENKKKPVAAPPKITVTTATAQKGNIGVYFSAIGTVTPVYTASISTQVDGLVLAVQFKEGQLVKKGDLLIEIDPRTYLANLLQAQGALERDENLLAQARMDLERYRAAWARNAIAKQILDDQEKLVLQDEGTAKSDRGTVQMDQLAVERSNIVAPITGRIGLRLVDPGNLVQASGNVVMAVITQLTPITVVFTMPEDNLGQVEARLRTGAKLSVDAYDRTAQTKIETGELLTLNNQIDTTTGTVKARAEFANKAGALFPNQFVNTRLLVNTLEGATLVPASAIQQNGQASFVYVIQDNVAHMRSVKPGVTDAGLTQVDGVNPGEVLANSSFDKLQDNTAVTTGAPPAAAGGVAPPAAAGGVAPPAAAGSAARPGSTANPAATGNAAKPAAAATKGGSTP